MKNISSILFRNYIFLLFIIVLASAFISSCKKNTGPPEPVITLTSPTDTTVINAGDTVLIKGTVTDNKSLHEVYITFHDASNDSVLLINDHPYTHGAKEYTFSYNWITSSPAIYQLTVDVLDHDEHTVTKDFLITVN